MMINRLISLFTFEKKLLEIRLLKHSDLKTFELLSSASVLFLLISSSKQRELIASSQPQGPFENARSWHSVIIAKGRDIVSYTSVRSDFLATLLFPSIQ